MLPHKPNVWVTKNLWVHSMKRYFSSNNMETSWSKAEIHCFMMHTSNIYNLTSYLWRGEKELAPKNESS